MGQKLQTVGEGRGGLVFRSLASVPPVFVVRVCSCLLLLCCVAAFAVPPSFLYA